LATTQKIQSEISALTAPIQLFYYPGSSQLNWSVLRALHCIETPLDIEQITKQLQMMISKECEEEIRIIAAKFKNWEDRNTIPGFLLQNISLQDDNAKARSPLHESCKKKIRLDLSNIDYSSSLNDLDDSCQESGSQEFNSEPQNDESLNTNKILIFGGSVSSYMCTPLEEANICVIHRPMPTDAFIVDSNSLVIVSCDRSASRYWKINKSLTLEAIELINSVSSRYMTIHYLLIMENFALAKYSTNGYRDGVEFQIWTCSCLNQAISILQSLIVNHQLSCRMPATVVILCS
jgi:hypothetical protein